MQVILLHLMLRNLYSCFSKVVLTNILSMQMYNGNHIDFVQEVKYLGVLLNSYTETSI